MNSSSRISGYHFWQCFIFMLNGLIFFMIGLDLPQIREGLAEEGINLGTAIGYGVLITVVLIIVRILAFYGAGIITQIMRRFIKVADERPIPIQIPLVMGWTGMRGVVSLAAALSIPEFLDSGEPFPQRNMILFITFVVILLTLVIQGLTLPAILKRIKFPDFEDYYPEEEFKERLRRMLRSNLHSTVQNDYQHMLKQFPQTQKHIDFWEESIKNESKIEMCPELKEMYLELLDKQRDYLAEVNKDPMWDEEIIRKHLHVIDLEELKISAM